MGFLWESYNFKCICFSLHDLVLVLLGENTLHHERLSTPESCKKNSSTSICSPTNHGDLYSALAEYKQVWRLFTSCLLTFEVTLVEIYHYFCLKNMSDMPLSLLQIYIFFINCAGFEMEWRQGKDKLFSTLVWLFVPSLPYHLICQIPSGEHARKAHLKGFKFSYF